MPDRIALVIPVRSFEHGKSRLADRFTPDQRSRLARAMAEVVVGPRDVDDGVGTIIVCNDDSVAHWARSRAATVVITDATGLNPSLTATRDSVLRSTDADWVVVAHADLPLATDIVGVIGAAIAAQPRDGDRVLIATDRRRDGTNVLALPRATFARWEFMYGPGSLEAHRAQAKRLGLQVIEIDDASLAIDIDTHDDLHAVRDFIARVLPDWKPAEPR
ncbi:MAG: 2-phospho-L-lactate guanylyltransferase [Actinobacteria bacterium]|nr:2-phospho-L-lactate guanylyltransferase [Actinomycetota bacterium]